MLRGAASIPFGEARDARQKAERDRRTAHIRDAQRRTELASNAAQLVSAARHREKDALDRLRVAADTDDHDARMGFRCVQITAAIQQKRLADSQWFRAAVKFLCAYL